MVLAGIQARPTSYPPCVLHHNLSTFKSFSEAVDDFESIFDGKLGLGYDKVIFFFEDGPPLRVSEDDPLKPDVLEVLSADFSSVGSKVKVRGILGSHTVVVMVVEVEGKDAGDVNKHWRDDDVLLRQDLPTLLGLYFRLLIVLFTKSIDSW